PARKRWRIGGPPGAATTPARTIDAFAARLRDQVDLDALHGELLAVVDQTMQPTRASLWLRHGPGGAWGGARQGSGASPMLGPGAAPRPPSSPVLTPPARGGKGDLEFSGRWSSALSRGDGSVGPGAAAGGGAATTQQKTLKARVRARRDKTAES